MNYHVKLDQFEGPFDLLLDLIDKKKLSINEISLSEVADQYLNYLKETDRFKIKEVASFLVIAATLILIKSRSLMPSLKLTGEEETEIEQLEDQLKLYEKYREMARKLSKIFGQNIIFEKEPYSQIAPVFTPGNNLNLIEIKNTLENLLNNLPPKKQELPQVTIKKVITLEQRINELLQKLEKNISFYFSDMRQTAPEAATCDIKSDLIINFLALLELTKRGFIMVRQEENFNEIEIHKI